MPSRLSSENSSISASTPPALERSARTASASLVASACACASCSRRKARLVEQRRQGFALVGAIRALDRSAQLGQRGIASLDHLAEAEVEAATRAGVGIEGHKRRPMGRALHEGPAAALF